MSTHTRLSTLAINMVVALVVATPSAVYPSSAANQDRETEVVQVEKQDQFLIAQENSLATPTPIAQSENSAGNSVSKIEKIAYAELLKKGYTPLHSEAPNGIFTGVYVKSADSGDEISSATSGDDFKFLICVNNITYDEQSATMSFIVRNPSGIYQPFTHEYEGRTLSVGHWCYHHGREEIPWNVPSGNWSFQGILHASSTTNGGSSVKTVNITSVSTSPPTPTPTEVPSVLIRRVYLANNRAGEGTATAVQAGSPFYPVVYWTNRARSKILADWTFSIRYGGQVIMQESGSRYADPGDRNWRMETFSKADMVMPTNVSAGTYTFWGQICANGQTNASRCEESTITFSVLSAASNSPPVTQVPPQSTPVSTPPPSNSECNPKPNGVILYELPNYKGKCITLADDSLGLAPVLDVHMLSIYGFSDLASSIRFVGSYATGWGALVFEHPSYNTEGRISHFASDDPDFINDTIGRGRADSIQISRLSSQPHNEVVVFVHGWQGTGSQLNEETVKDQFPDIRIRLMQAGYPIYYAVLKSSKDNGTPSIFSDENYNLLKEAIRKAKIESGKNKVILIAHSMGGLISRRYVNANNPDYAGDVSKLFTFGTPHEGIVFSMYESWIFRYNGGKPVNEYCNPPPQISIKLGNPPRDAACDYVYNMHEFNRLYPLRNDVNHYFVSGDNPPIKLRQYCEFSGFIPSCKLTAFSNDGVTPLYSGRAANLSARFINRLSTESSHVLVANGNFFSGYFYDGPQYFKSGGTSSWLNCLKPVLNDNNISSCNGGDNGILPADVSPTATADDRKFISRQYRDFFRRDSDAGGVAFWQNHLINIGWSREQLIEEGFYNSNEFQTRGTAVIVRFYFAALNRRPDYSGLMDHVLGLYGDGNDPGKLYQRLGDIGQAFANSREFQDKYGSLDNRAFLTRVYQNVLNRDPDEGGLQDWLAYLESGQTRGQFLRDFLIAPEVRNRFRPKEVLVSSIYAVMLNCEPSARNYNFWVNSNTSIQSFIAEVIRDPNYINNGRCEG